ncbi:MAG TPA: hypothetical protein VMW52_09875 [Phycisphaerae bacterium]|nr:hypothetical protein [Phycisphaerae bacterium]
MSIGDVMYVTEGMTAAENRHAVRLAKTAYRRLHAKADYRAYVMWLFGKAHERAAKEQER